MKQMHIARGRFQPSLLNPKFAKVGDAT